MLPNFIVIGAAKAGTTALYWYLDEHPQTYMSPLKETNFFAYGRDESGRLLYGDPELHKFPIRSDRQYRSLFAGVRDAMAIGEVSPLYLECPQAADRIARMLPDAKIICGLRNPVDRAYSDYLMYLRQRGRRFHPEQDLSSEAQWARRDSHWMQIGRYHELLLPFYRTHSREQIHVYLFDDFVTDTLGVVQNIYRFLGVDDSFAPDLCTPHNVGGVPASILVDRLLTNRRLRAKVDSWIPDRIANFVRRLRTSNLQRATDIPAELRAELADYFKDDIIETALLVDRDLRHWL